MSDAIPQQPFQAYSSQASMTERRPRLWPGVVIVILYWAILKVPGWVAPGTMLQFMVSGFGSMVVPILFAIWWLFFSRIRWADRFIGLLVCAVVGAAAFSLFHPSLRGTRPDEAIFGLAFHVLPVVLTGWVVWLVVARSLSRTIRWTGLLTVLLLAWGYFTTLRFEGTNGSFAPDFSYRWEPTPEDKYLAERAASKPPAPPAADAAAATPLQLQPGDWPGFRGPNRDSRRTGVRIATNWKQVPPMEVWRHRVGPGWSSFAVIGNRLYTQEQRGGDEVVVCYDADTGAEMWVHADGTRFEETLGGAGPRATPTFHAGKIYTLGAKGQLNCLDAATGKKVWARDIVVDSGRDAAEDPKERFPIWGFAASPLVVQGIVMVYAGGPDEKGVLGYRAESGELAWTAGSGGDSYCSLQPARIDGIEQIIISNSSGLTAFDPVSGKVLWQHEWAVGKEMNRVVQPALVGGADVLIGTGFGFGTHRVHIGRSSSGLTAEPVWETTAISPYFNDLVIHKDHIYGFHNNLFACVSLADGKLKWKERGYDNGQVLLLPDQDLLLIQAEKGDVALVEARPDRRNELGRFSAIKGKTWNHPVVAHGRLYVRNGEEAACYQLTEEGGAPAAPQK